MKHPNLHITTRQRANFKTLGISPTTDFSVIRTAYKAKALSLHPDKSRDEDTTPAFCAAKQALEELEFFKDFPMVGLQKQTDEEREQDEAREELAKDEEERTKDRMEKKESEVGTYAFAVGKHVVPAEEKVERVEQKRSGMAFVMKKKRGGGGGGGGGQEQHESKAETAKPKQPESQQQNIKKK